MHGQVHRHRSLRDIRMSRYLDPAASRTSHKGAEMVKRNVMQEEESMKGKKEIKKRQQKIWVGVRSKVEQRKGKEKSNEVKERNGNRNRNWRWKENLRAWQVQFWVRSHFDNSKQSNVELSNVVHFVAILLLAAAFRSLNKQTMLHDRIRRIDLLVGLWFLVDGLGGFK